MGGKLIVVALALIAGCYQPQFVEGLACSSKGDCPPDQECSPIQNRCYSVIGLDDARLGPDAPRLADAFNPGVTCDPLTQTGCSATQKCTWLLDSMTPYVGHIGCAPSGTGALGDSCIFGAPGSSGYDNCAQGFVCGNFRGTGTGQCKVVCDPQGGPPQCDSTRTCVSYAGLFSTSGTTTSVAAVCDTVCNPLTDNDFDGSAGSGTKSTSACGALPAVGCYGYPSFGTLPTTAWSCTNDVNYDSAQPLGLRHRVACTQANGCADPAAMISVNSCNQGYLPLLVEQTGSTQTICVAICKPAICYSGNCGASNTNRNGDPASIHQCTTARRLGSFATTEHCQYLWWREVDGSGSFLASPTSDTVGVCMDFAKYRYDSNVDGQTNTSDQFLPNCDTLGSGQVVGGNPAIPTSYFGAADLGCVPSSFLPVLATGKGGLSPAALRKRAAVDLPRMLYHRAMRD